MMPPIVTKFTKALKHFHTFTSTLCHMARCRNSFGYITFELYIPNKGNFAPRVWTLGYAVVCGPPKVNPSQRNLTRRYAAAPRGFPWVSYNQRWHVVHGRSTVRAVLQNWGRLVWWSCRTFNQLLELSHTARGGWRVPVGCIADVVYSWSSVLLGVIWAFTIQ